MVREDLKRHQNKTNIQFIKNIKKVGISKLSNKKMSA